MNSNPTPKAYSSLALPPSATLGGPVFKAAPAPTRSSSADSCATDFFAYASSSQGSPQILGQRPSFSRHQSLSGFAKIGLHPVESHLDLAQALGAADASLLKDALLHAASTFAKQGAALHAPSGKRRAASAPASPISHSSRFWYTDAANPVIAGMQLRHTVAHEIQPHISQMPGGVQLVHMVLPKSIEPTVATDLMTRGQSRYAAMLKLKLKTNELFKVTFTGSKRLARDGWYAFVIDQNDTLLVSLASATGKGAPNGAHAQLAGGLPVRFAGELQIVNGRVAYLNNASGHYRTPPSLFAQALSQPLLFGARLELIGG